MKDKLQKILALQGATSMLLDSRQPQGVERLTKSIFAWRYSNAIFARSVKHTLIPN